MDLCTQVTLIKIYLSIIQALPIIGCSLGARLHCFMVVNTAEAKNYPQTTTIEHVVWRQEVNDILRRSDG